jgi:nitroreductase
VWNVKANQFPENGKMESKLKFLIRYAILAPSGHNTQPWKFKIGKNTIEVWADRARRRKDIDPNDRELFISLGGAIANLEVAAKFFGMMFEKKYVGGNSNLAVIFKFTEGKTNSEGQDLFNAITERRVNREEYNDKTMTPEMIKKLTEENGEYGRAKMLLINQKKMKEELANLVDKSDRVWFKSKKLVDEMEYWLQDDLAYSKNGLPTGVLRLYKLATEVKYLISRDTQSVTERALRDKKLIEKSAAMVIIWTKNDIKEEWIEAGELYEKLALRLVGDNIQNAFFNTVIELKTQRSKLEKILKIKGRAQLMLRLGYSKKNVRHSPRREVEEVLM